MEKNINKFKTPYFIIHKDEMDKLVEDVSNSLCKYWETGIVGYSFKTNNLPWVIEYMKNKGFYAEVVSSDEFDLAVEMGFSYEKIIFNGPVKGKEEFKNALENPVIINLDSKRELRWLSECKNIKAFVGLRVNFDLETICVGETQCGYDDGRFGFSYETGEFENALNVIKKSGAILSGIHLHCSSKTRSLNIYRAIAKMAVKLVEKYDLELSYVDIGGGFFGGVSGKPTFENYFSAIKEIFNKSSKLEKVNLIVEPGISLVGATIDYVVSVTDVKATLNNNFVVTDGSRIHIDPLMRKSSYTYLVEWKNNVKRDFVMGKQTLSGFTCLENDRFFSLENERKFVEGDRITFQKVGAYTMGMSPLFIQFFPTVYVKTQENVEIARKKWTAKELIQR